MQKNNWFSACQEISFCLNVFLSQFLFLGVHTLYSFSTQTSSWHLQWSKVIPLEVMNAVMFSSSCLQPESLAISTVAVGHTCCHSECRRSNTGVCSAVWSSCSKKQEWTNYDNQIKSNMYNICSSITLPPRTEDFCYGLQPHFTSKL